MFPQPPRQRSMGGGFIPSAGGDFFGDTHFIQQYPDDSFLARIVGRSGSAVFPGYSWVRVQQIAEGKYRDELSQAAQGTETDWPAHEASGHRYVPIDGSAIVRLRRSFGGNYLEFNYSEPDSFTAQITGGGGDDAKYAWLEVSQTSSDNFATVGGGRSGSLTINYAVEQNGNTELTADIIVRLHRGYCSGAPRVHVTRTQAGGEEEEIQEIWIENAVGGTFTLTLLGEETDDIDFDADAAALDAAIGGLANIATRNVTGAGTEDDPFVVEFSTTSEVYDLFQPDTTDLKSDQIWVFSHCCPETPGIDPECVDDCDADDFSSNLCVAFAASAATGLTSLQEFLRDTLDGMQLTLTESSPHFWQGTGETPDGDGELTFTATPFFGTNGGNNCGSWMFNGASFTHPGLAAFGVPTTMGLGIGGGALTCSPLTIECSDDFCMIWGSESSQAVPVMVTITAGSCEGGGSGSGGGGESCCSPTPGNDLVGTVTAKSGCATALPDTLNFVSEPDPFAEGKYRYKCSTAFSECGTDQDGTTIDLCGHEDGFPQLSFAATITSADEWTCAPFSATFVVDDGGGNGFTLTLVEA